MSGDGPGASSLRTFLKPASSSQLLISLKLKVSPFSVLTSICTANISEGSGLVRSSFTSHSAIAIFAFAVQDVAERGDVVAAAETRLQYIALDIIKAIGDAELLGDSFCRRNHSCPIDCGDPHAGRFLGKGNTPNARTGSKIEHANFVLCFRQLQMIAEFLRRWIAHWDDAFHQLAEKFRAFGLLVYGGGRTTFANDVGQSQPS